MTLSAIRPATAHFRLLAAERRLLWTNAVIGALAVLVALTMQRQVTWSPFLSGYAATLGLAIVGAYLRQAKSSPRLALALIGVAIYAGFIAVSLVFIFVLLPLSRPLIDPALIALDLRLGYHWPGFIAWLAEYPALGKLLGYVYQSSQMQLLLTIAVLAALSRELALHRFLAVGIITLIIAVIIWWLAPSIGPSAFHKIPQDDLVAIGLIFHPGAGEHLRHLIEVGPAQVTPEVFIGVIAFPSYHMIMACLAVWYTRGTIAFFPLVVLNCGMVPATLSHGGHHLVDILAGLVVFAAGVWIANRLIRPEAQP